MGKKIIDFGAPGICGNFFVVANFKNDSYERSRALFFRLQEDLYGPDQGIICILMQEMFTSHAYYEHSLFTPHPQDWPMKVLNSSVENKRPYFLHAYGQPKFWNGLMNPLWQRFYEEWLNLGGSRFASNHLLGSLKIFLKRCLKRIRAAFISA